MKDYCQCKNRPKGFKGHKYCYFCHKIIKDKNLIPQGLYCYAHMKFNEKTNQFKLIGVCPYWSIQKNRPKQECGYCAYLNKGDWDINAEAEITPIYYDKDGKKIKGKTLRGKEVPFPVSLLWDMVKECSIN